MTALHLFLAVSLAATPVEVRPVLSRSNRRGGVAIVVGVETYRGKLPAATYAKHDAESFASFAESTLGIPKERIKVLTNEFAAASDIQGALKWAAQTVKPGGSVVFYFSGHGTPNTRSGEPMLVPYDADPDEIDSSALPVPDLVKKIEAIPGSEKLVFLDACFSGTGERSLLSRGKRPLVPVRALPSPKAALVFSATTAKGISGPSHLSEHGLFTYYLLQGMRGGADIDADHVVSAAELANYVYRHVSDEAREHGGEQQPVAQLGKSGDLAVVDSPGPDVAGPATEPQPPAPPPAPRFPAGSEAERLDAQCPRDGSACAKLGQLLLDGKGVPKDLDLANATFLKGCDANNAESCEALAMCYQDAKGVPRDEARGAVFHKKACDLGDMDGCVWTGLHTKEGGAALAYLTKACEGGRAWGCNWAGVFHDNGEHGLPVNRAEAAKWFQKACDSGDDTGCKNLALVGEQGGIPMAKDKVAALYQRACEMGNGYACVSWGNLLLEGAGIPKDVARANATFLKGCDANNAESCEALAMCYQDAKGVPRDEARGAVFHKKACDLGDMDGCIWTGLHTKGDPAAALAYLTKGCEGGRAWGCNWVGVFHDNGEQGLPVNRAEAAKWFQKACDGGDSFGCKNLALVAEQGGVPMAKDKVAALYQRACEMGNGYACHAAGVMHRDGKGVPANLARAKEFFARGCSSGDQESCKEPK